MEEKAIRATYDDTTITIYQAFNKAIANSAVKAQTFVCPPFKKERMTWIKPSFLWMMYRSGWATKENQECILAIKIKREGFEWALQNSCLSHFDKNIHLTQESWKKSLHSSAVRIQWDPEKDIFLQPLPYRSIQIGLSGVAVEKYISDWIVEIEDITEKVIKINSLLIKQNVNNALKLIPQEVEYKINL
jgi:hypothetical protein